MGDCANPRDGWASTCGHALPPQIRNCQPPLDPRIPSLWNTYPGWWNGIYDYYYGMSNYSKFCENDDKYTTWQGFQEDREGDEIEFKLKDAEKLRWDYWPGTCPLVGTVAQGEVIAPPGTQSVLKMADSVKWIDHVIPPQDATPENVYGTQAPKSVFDLPIGTFNDRMLHKNTIQPF